MQTRKSTNDNKRRFEVFKASILKQQRNTSTNREDKNNCDVRSQRWAIAVLFILCCVFLLYCGGWRIQRHCNGTDSSNAEAPTQDCM